mmetsp:Transcript_7863/g.17296  ORF Transcript_7863/g.17296 Transcript_7863/m.17296 type:complete len:752 (+) Transcript_7863:90-2345(+)
MFDLFKSQRVGKCTLCGFVREITRSEYSSRDEVACDHASLGCPGKIVYAANLKVAEVEALNSSPCSCLEPGIKLELSSMAGEAWSIGVEKDWLVVDVKRKLEKITGMPVTTQCLILDQAVLRNSMVLEALITAGIETKTVTVLRQDPHVGSWLGKVAADWKVLENAPQEIISNSEVVLEALASCRQALKLAHASLLSDAHFLRQARDLQGYSEGSCDWIKDIVDLNLALCCAAAFQESTLAEAVVQLLQQQTGEQGSKSKKIMSLIRGSSGGMNISSIVMQDRVMLIHSLLLARRVVGAVFEQLLQDMLHGMCAAILEQTFTEIAQEDLQIAMTLLQAQHAAQLQNIEAPSRWGQKPTFSRTVTADYASRSGFAREVVRRHREELMKSERRTDVQFLLTCCDLLPSTSISWEAANGLVSVCRAHGETTSLRKAFVAGAADSDECAEVFDEVMLPLTVLADATTRNNRANLFQRILLRWGGAAEVPAFIWEDRRGLRQLLELVKEQRHLDICGSPLLVEAMQKLAADTSEWQGAVLDAGSLLLSVVFVAKAVPEDFLPPLSWLPALNGMLDADHFAIDCVLRHLEGCEDDKLLDMLPQHWQRRWDDATSAQCTRAVELVKRWSGLATGSRPDHQRDVVIFDALRALPLERLQDLRLLIAQEWPPQVMSALAFQQSRNAAAKADAASALADEARGAAREARRLAIQAQERAERAEQRAQQAERHANEAQRKADYTERELRRVKQAAQEPNHTS